MRTRLGVKRGAAWMCRRRKCRTSLWLVAVSWIYVIDGNGNNNTDLNREVRSIQVLLICQEIVEITRLVVRKPVLGFPAREVLQCLEHGDVCDVGSFEVGAVDAAVVVLGQVHCEVELYVWEAGFPC